MLQLGLKGRYSLPTKGAFRPYLSLGVAYATHGVRYEANTGAMAGGGGGASSPFGGGGTASYLHRHRGVGLPLGIGVRYDQPLRAFHADLLVPIALELSYTHNFWMGLQRKPSIEIVPDALVGARPFLDYLGLVLTVGFLR
jgi:hypothetical protein